MNKAINFIVIFGVISTLFFACSEDVYQRTESGLKYVKHVTNDGPKPQEGDIMYIFGQYRTDYDSIFCCSIGRDDSIAMELLVPSYQGSMEDGFKELSAGDSATFYLPADSLFKHRFRMPLPSYIKPGSGVYFDVKLLSFETRTMFEEKKKLAEMSTLAAYAAQNKIDAEPTQSGLYFQRTKEGNGPKVNPGELVTMEYKGMLFNGTVFDASDRRDEEFTFTLGIGQVIRGWDEAVSMMNVGDEATILIPSYLAYGQRGAGKLIPPNSPLVFEIKVVKAEQ
ncbi:MAG: FKBP-type peptidyl-prolyl cis-trans isomerase [Bacteroidia bacterium]|nr:FKBP-type peptidyl-prolyl cis-trans isomerase [Bacteroidia bacterium]